MSRACATPPSIPRLLAVVAARSAGLLSSRGIAGELGIDHKTVAAQIRILEDLFLVCAYNRGTNLEKEPRGENPKDLHGRYRTAHPSDQRQRRATCPRRQPRGLDLRDVRRDGARPPMRLGRESRLAVSLPRQAAARGRRRPRARQRRGRRRRVSRPPPQLAPRTSRDSVICARSSAPRSRPASCSTQANARSASASACGRFR